MSSRTTRVTARYNQSCERLLTNDGVMILDTKLSPAQLGSVDTAVNHAAPSVGSCRKDAAAHKINHLLNFIRTGIQQQPVRQSGDCKHQLMYQLLSMTTRRISYFQRGTTSASQRTRAAVTPGTRPINRPNRSIRGRFMCCLVYGCSPS